MRSFQSPEEPYLFQDDSLDLELEPRNNDEELSVSTVYISETDPSYSLNDPSISSVPPTRPQFPMQTQHLASSIVEREAEHSFGIEYSHSRPQPQYPQETGLTNGARKYNEDLPPIPTQDTTSANPDPQLRYPQESLYGAAEAQDRVQPPSTLSMQTGTEEQNQPNYAQARPQQPRRTQLQVSFAASKQDKVEPPSLTPSIPTQQPRETQVSSSANKPKDSIEPPSSTPSVPSQEPSQSNQFSLTHSQQKAQVSPVVVREPRDRPDLSPSILTTQEDRSADANNTDTRPHLLHGTPSQMDSQYVAMLLALDDIPTLHNVYAAFFNWILLAGFILFPGTFTSLKNLGASGHIEQEIVNAVTSISL